jgi:3-dehydroquinate synthase
LDRKGFVVALGGGVVGDLTGFLAATFLRGIDFVQVPTTLLSMVDSSVGGKTGINLKSGKNLVGAFYQPKLVLADLTVLKTLPIREYRAGMAEVVKYGLIRDPEILRAVGEKSVEEIFSDEILLNELIERSVQAKIEVVEEDEEDHGQRRILNFGHTYGHGIERLYEISHGKAVAYGMVVALDFSVQLGLADKTLKDKIITLLRSLHLLPDLQPDPEEVMRVISHDKKRKGEVIPFILLKQPGEVEIVPLRPEEIGAMLKKMDPVTG